ncbi:hypothetical protein GOODEAATRI_008018 [Goodea atripinnis]|uniref:Uncharacterized protein n=1 Tax=Goodea atripinnis TaxID=208336 RepID=A0ABV0PCC6_9TELE
MAVICCTFLHKENIFMHLYLIMSSGIVVPWPCPFKQISSLLTFVNTPSYLHASRDVSPHQQKIKVRFISLGRSTATSCMFLTHPPALHHALMIATTRDLTLERQLAAGLLAEAKTAKLCIRISFLKEWVYPHVFKSSTEITVTTNHKVGDFLEVNLHFFQMEHKFIDHHCYLIDPSALSLCPAMMNVSAPMPCPLHNMRERLSCGTVH